MSSPYWRQNSTSGGYEQKEQESPIRYNPRRSWGDKTPPYQAPKAPWTKKNYNNYDHKHEPPRPSMKPPKDRKEMFMVVVLALLFGIFGAHNFYLGKYKLGAIQLGITLISSFNLAPAVAVWGIIEGLLYLTGYNDFYTRDGWGRPITR